MSSNGVYWSLKRVLTALSALQSSVDSILLLLLLLLGAVEVLIDAETVQGRSASSFVNGA